MNIYIPQIESPVFSYPLLAATVDNIDKDMLDWTDPEHVSFVAQIREIWQLMNAMSCCVAHLAISSILSSPTPSMTSLKMRKL